MVYKHEKDTSARRKINPSVRQLRSETVLATMSAAHVRKRRHQRSAAGVGLSLCRSAAQGGQPRRWWAVDLSHRAWDSLEMACINRSHNIRRGERCLAFQGQRFGFRVDLRWARPVASRAGQARINRNPGRSGTERRSTKSRLEPTTPTI